MQHSKNCSLPYCDTGIIKMKQHKLFLIIKFTVYITSSRNDISVSRNRANSSKARLLVIK